MFVAPLALHGFDVNTDETDELEIARQELMALRPHLQSIDSDNYPDTLRNGDAVLAPRLERHGLPDAAGSPDYKDTGYTVPTEGTIYWVDTWVLLDQAPHPNAAYTFLNWIQDPNVQVIESLYAGYASCNDDGQGAAAARVRRTIRPSTCRTTQLAKPRRRDRPERQQAAGRHLGRVQVQPG